MPFGILLGLQTPYRHIERRNRSLLAAVFKCILLFIEPHPYHYFVFISNVKINK